MVFGQRDQSHEVDLEVSLANVVEPVNSRMVRQVKERKSLEQDLGKCLQLTSWQKEIVVAQEEIRNQ